VQGAGSARRPVLRLALASAASPALQASLSALLRDRTRREVVRPAAGGVAVTAFEVAGIGAGVVAAVILTVERELARIERQVLSMVNKEPAPLPTARVVRGR
jgi:hypothetical protein